MNIRVDDLSGSQIAALLELHLQSMSRHSPAKSIHALDLKALRHPDITFWTAWENQALLGCGALRDLGGRHGEIKSVRTAADHQGRGFARGLLHHIIEEARRRSFTRLSLETGSVDAFEPARRLYPSCGFKFCGPFDGYVLDPYSVFMTKSLN